MMRHRLALLVAGLVAVLSSGCSSLYAPPQAWEKGNLSKPEMTMGGDPLDARFTQHINGSKEGSSGGYGVGGGGCGCN
ncbi:DUF4266 domain-containing protein [Aquabacterium sp.]|uniref:DUF4266 domain-containing protein n=1 Tax=Aquabacterium sp. TaxID=1872578 RepID=UPI0035B03698